METGGVAAAAQVTAPVPKATTKGPPPAAWRLTLQPGGDAAEDGQSNWKYQKKSKGVGEPTAAKEYRQRVEGKGDTKTNTGGASGSGQAPTTEATGDQEGKKQESDGADQTAKDKEKQWGAGDKTEGGGYSKDKKGKWIKSQDRNLHNLLNLLVKSNLQTHQKMRDLQGVMYDVFLVASELPAVKSMISAGQAYAQRVRATRENEGVATGLGPPHPQVWMALLEVLKEADVGAANRQKLAEVYERHNSLTVEQVCEEVRYCRQDTTFSSDRRRVTLSVTQDLRPLLIASMTQVGAEYRPGRPPVGGMERELAAWLPALWAD